MIRKIIGFIEGKGLEDMTGGRSYYFKGNHYAFEDDAGDTLSWSECFIESDGDTPIYEKEIDLELLQRARDMVEHLKTLKPKDYSSYEGYNLCIRCKYNERKVQGTDCDGCTTWMLGDVNCGNKESWRPRDE